MKIHKFDISHKYYDDTEPYFCVKCFECFDVCCKEYLRDLKDFRDKSIIEKVGYLNELQIKNCTLSDEEWIVKQIIE